MLLYNLTWGRAQASGDGWDGHGKGSSSMCTKEQSVVLVREENEVAQACVEMEFNVSAANAVGQSDVGSIDGGFPIGETTEKQFSHF